MLIVVATPPGGQFIEFLRVNIVASDDGNVPVITGPFEIVYTLDGSFPEVDIDGNPLGTAKKRRSPIRNLPIDHPTTMKFFARTTDGVTTTAISSVYFDVQELTAKNEIKTAAPTVLNYTLTVENGDIVKTDRGSYGIVFGPDKTAQDVREVILVENVPDQQNPGARTLPRFGSAVSRLLGKSLPPSFTRGQIQTSVFEALTFLAELQRREEVPQDEQIRKIRNVNVELVPDQPTSFKYTFSVELAGGLVVSQSGVVVGG